MQTETLTGPEPGKMAWTGRILSGLVIAFLIFDGTIKITEMEVAVSATRQLGYPGSIVFGLGVLTFILTALYAYPRTAVLGAILLTGLMGGAITTHLRIGNPLFSHQLFGVYLGLMIWGGLFLRDERLRALIPLRR